MESLLQYLINEVKLYKKKISKSVQSKRRTYEKSKIHVSDRLHVTGFAKKRLGAKGEILVQPVGYRVPCNSICRESKTRLLISETGTRSFSSVNKPKARSLPAMARDAIKGYVCGEIPLLPSITPPPLIRSAFIRGRVIV